MNTNSTNSQSPDLVSTQYEPGLAGARRAFEHADGYRNACSPGADPSTLRRFLIAYCARGVAMTEPVEGWISAAGSRCVEVGYKDLGAALQRHAKHEAGHHQMMINDTRALVDMWNRSEVSPFPLDADCDLDADRLLSTPPSLGVRCYIELHEQTIAGDTPFHQLAIEYEIESLSVRCGPPMMRNIGAVCGPEWVQSLSFLTDHIAIDEAHTIFNRRQLTEFLLHSPEHVDGLIEAGRSALLAYSMFLDDCWAWAESDHAQ